LPLSFPILCLLPFSKKVNEILVGFPEFGSTSITLEANSEAKKVTFFPEFPACLERSNLVCVLTPSTTSLPVLGKTFITLPVLPLSLPDRSLTVSPVFILSLFIYTLIEFTNPDEFANLYELRIRCFVGIR